MEQSDFCKRVYFFDTNMIKNPPWWNRRTRLERSLLAIAIVMCMAMAISLVFVGYQYHKTLEFRSAYFDAKADSLGASINSLESDFVKLCLSPGCIKEAARLIENMDTKIDPCDDFYQFACGGWMERHVILDDRTGISLFSQLQNDLNHKLRTLLEGKRDPNEPLVFKNLHRMYKSCMNLTAIEEVGTEPMLNLINALGGYPVLDEDKWDQDKFNWSDKIITIRNLGFSYDILIDILVTPDIRNNTNFIVEVDQATLGVPDRSYLLRGFNDTIVELYYKLMVESAVMLGANRAKAKEDMLEVLVFETILANYSLPRDAKRNISLLYNKMSIAELQEMSPNIPWLKLLTNIFNQNFDENENVIVQVPSYIRNIDKTLKNTNKRILANYIIWRTIFSTFASLGKQWRNLVQEFSKAMTGQDKEEPRWEQCLNSLTGTLGIALSSIYVKHHFKGTSKHQALEMVNYIHREFLKILDEIDWMDKKTNQFAKEKAEKILCFIGYPDELLNITELEKLYENLELSPNDYFNNIRTLRKWATDFSAKQLRKPNIKGDWRKHAKGAVVNAYYNSLDNSIEFPAGILQSPFFSDDRPSYANFGSIGFVIGHEITHGFDDRGRQFDKDGNNHNWWNHETDMAFRERTQCMIEQYSNYTVVENGLKVNGFNTQGENIADNGGLKQAYRAYKQWTKEHGEELPLPGLNFTTDQLFWMSAANVWCGKYRPEILKLRIQLGNHSPPRFRVIGPMSNIHEFSKSFKCPLGSNMNPVKKCHVW